MVYVVALIVGVGILNLTHIGCLAKFVGITQCPFCGMTRAYIALLTGEFRQAFQFNPLLPLCLLAIALIPVQREDLSRRQFVAYNFVLSAIGVAFGIRWVALFNN